MSLIRRFILSIVAVCGIASMAYALPAPTFRQLSDDVADRVQIHDALVWIVANSDGKYKMPAIEPVLIRVSPYAMSELACGGHQPCHVWGLHPNGSYIVYIVAGMPPEADIYVALHETVHYLQSRLPTATIGSCMAQFADEQEAHRLHNLFRVKVQGYKGLPSYPMADCKS